MSGREPAEPPTAPRGPSDGYRRDRDADGHSGRRYEDRDAGRSHGSGSRRYEDDYRSGGRGRGGGYDRGRSDRDRGGYQDRRPYDDDRRREGHRVGDRDGGNRPPAGPRDDNRDRRNGRPYDRPFPDRPRSRSPVRPLDKKSIEEGRRQRELERAQRAQRGESVHSAGSGAAGRDGTPGAAAVPPIRGQESRRDGRRDRSQEGYRRPRNDRGEHVDSRGSRDKPDNGEGEGEGEGEGREDEEDDEDMGAEQDDMAAMLGFGGFGSTKNQKVSGNVEGAVQIKQQRTWRQYMNRRGGFNRPLDPVKEPKVWH